jgi:Ribosomal protein L5
MSLKQRYRETIQPKLLKDLSLSNIHEVPKVVKVTVNRGLGEAAQNAKSLEASVNELAQITGQKVVVTRAKKAIAGFKIRQGMPIGCAVTLRGERMYAFLERLINLALPPNPRLQRRQPQELRRSGQLHPGGERANHLP